ncbi:protein FAR1-RELATED SEQUENCE 5-like [Primulina tabacum]|uniref:protein FAR1-RELATED SEQUENCE 5-like n=1 Tax=Primulina tabacum TaxID=48773 RepID=UPI003F592401
MDSSSNIEFKPKIGMEFDSLDESWKFWVEYGGKTGFGVRKHYFNKNKNIGFITSYKYVCCKEGVRKKDKRDSSTLNSRLETRTNCKVRMGVTFVDSKYKVNEFIEEHNHPLYLQETVHMLSSQRKITEVQAYEIDLAEDVGLKQKSNFQLMSKHAGGIDGLGYTMLDAKNYIRSKRQRSMMDVEEQITNIFWADARMLIEYEYFGDVVSLDTTYCTNRAYRPLAIFSGFNHHRGADQAMTKALLEVMPEVFHGLCTWHLMQNGIKHLENLMKDGYHFLTDFKICMYGIDDETRFEEAWSILLEQYNIQENTWLQSTYNIKEKWATCYMNKAFTLGMRSTQLSESVNSDIKSCMKPDLDIMQFFKHFEGVLEEKWYNELRCEFETSQKLSRLKLESSPMLRQLSEIYTLTIFHLFQVEFVLFAASYIKYKNETQPLFEYIVGRIDKEGEWRVTFNPSTKMISRSCRKFEMTGLLCCHAVKVYDVQDVKKLPEHYILNRWTRKARSGVVHDCIGNEVEEDPKRESTERYRKFCMMLVRLATEASVHPSTFSFVHNLVCDLTKQVMEMRLTEDITHDELPVSCSAPPVPNAQFDHHHHSLEAMDFNGDISNNALE